MRKDLGKALRAEFESQLRVRSPEYERVRGHQVYPGDRLYRAHTSSGGFAFLRLVLDTRGHDTFTLEIGWSPSEEPPRNVLWRDEAERNPPSGSMRLPWLWCPGGLEPWWTVLDGPDFDAFIPTSEHGEPEVDQARVDKFWERTFAGPTAGQVDGALARIPGLVAEALDKWQALGQPWLAARLVASRAV